MSSLHPPKVGSKAGAVATGSGSRSWPETFAIFRCLSPSLNPISSFRHVVRSMRISRTTHSCPLHAKGYATYQTGNAFNRSCFIQPPPLEAFGVERWLGVPARDLKSGTYRPLDIPRLQDRVAQTAAMLVLSPIFEADLQPEEYAYWSAGTRTMQSGVCTGC